LIEEENQFFPVQYLGANVPHASAAGSVFAPLRAILGLMPDAPRGKSCSIRCCHTGFQTWPCKIWVSAGVDLIRFRRKGHDTKFDVLDGDPEAMERCKFGAQFDQFRSA
jgi:hypothetical protein